MKALLGNHRHGAKTFLVFTYDGAKSPALIRKSASSSDGIKSLTNERRGIDWYNKTASVGLEYEYKEFCDTYHSIDIRFNAGCHHPRLGRGYLGAVKYLEKTMLHYCDVWRNCSSNVNELSPSHGDLSLVGNIIFDKNINPLFVDWEHFSLDVMPIGFDVVSCIFEIIYYETRKRPNLSIEVVEHAKGLLKNLHERGFLADIFLAIPLSSAIGAIKNNQNIWCGQHLKLPITKFNDYEVSLLDELFSLV